MIDESPVQYFFHKFRKDNKNLEGVRIIGEGTTYRHRGYPSGDGDVLTANGTTMVRKQLQTMETVKCTGKCKQNSQLDDV
ncbi:unnamed protein product [Angiostrongylus costaricensis]|uniref:Astacin domain-containing protein n=1 Tax=Angiostrongylus costaricensis TaxID=334426 RepID=A0A0R3PRN9_ANGCS|nr:unnamed protein product [Angiostrongylus costaricensis]